MADFDLNNYKTVKQRKTQFYTDFPDGRIVVEMVNNGSRLDYSCMKAYVYLSADDQFKNCPRGVGYALELRDTKLSVSAKGKQYKAVNYTSWTENAEESAVGRALDNAGYSLNEKPSREEMEKVERMQVVMETYNHKLELTDKEKQEIMEIEDPKALAEHCKTLMKTKGKSYERSILEAFNAQKEIIKQLLKDTK